MRKSKEEILNDLLTRLQAKTDITHVDPGTVARTFIDILTEEFDELYSQLDFAMAMSFVSTAGGRYLDLIGELLNCKREPGESDENYRSRIINQVYVVAGANLTAIRLAVLSVPGVKDAIFKEYTHGAGSFTCYVIPSNGVQPSPDLLEQVENAINDAKAYGVFADVRGPVLIPVDLKVRLVFEDGAGTSEKNSIRQNVGRQIQKFMSELDLGSPLLINDLIHRIMEVSPRIQNVDVYSLKVKGINRFIQDVHIKEDEQFVLNSIDVT